MEMVWSVFSFDEAMYHRPDYPGKDKTLRRFEKFTLDHGGFQVKYNQFSLPSCSIFWLRFFATFHNVMCLINKSMRSTNWS